MPETKELLEELSSDEESTVGMTAVNAQEDSVEQSSSESRQDFRLCAVQALKTRRW